MKSLLAVGSRAGVDGGKGGGVEVGGGGGGDESVDETV